MKCEQSFDQFNGQPQTFEDQKLLDCVFETSNDLTPLEPKSSWPVGSARENLLPISDVASKSEMS